MIIIAGLGNKGSKYDNTRHNVGFKAIDSITNHYNLHYTSKFNSLIAELNLGDNKILLLKPQTFMNISGKALLEASSFYKINPSEVIVIYDDLDLPLGKTRYKINSGHGGHNGIKSIQSCLGNNFNRVKIGIDRPINKDFAIENYVLSKFTAEETPIIDRLMNTFTNNFNLLAQKQFVDFVNILNKEAL